jgi:hypothetical protein
MKVLFAAFSGLAAFVAVVIMVIAITYLRCLAAGISYNFSIVVPIAIKGGVVPGGAIFILTLIGAPRPRSPH